MRETSRAASMALDGAGAYCHRLGSVVAKGAESLRRVIAEDFPKASNTGDGPEIDDKADPVGHARRFG